jgi:hypothetical protein
MKREAREDASGVVLVEVNKLTEMQTNVRKFQKKNNFQTISMITSFDMVLI